MGILVLSSLFAGLLAFQNASARYFFAMARGGVLPAGLAKTNRRGAPSNASLLTSIIAGVVIVIFAVAQLDPFLTMFSWFSGLAVLAIVVIEILVSIAVIVYFIMGRWPEWWWEPSSTWRRNRPVRWKWISAPTSTRSA